MKKILSIFLALIIIIGIVPIAELDLQANAITESDFNSKLSSFKTNKYNNNSTYIDNPSKTGGYQCFGFANELALWIFDSYPTSSMSAYTVNSGWSRTYGGAGVDNLSIGDIVRYKYHSIFITGISGDTIYFAQANVPSGTNKVTYDNSISRSTLKNYCNSQLTHSGATTQGWVAHNITNPFVAIHTHSYEHAFEGAHPHREYMICDCGNWYYTGTDLMSVTQTSYESVHPHREYKHCTMCNENYLTGTDLMSITQTSYESVHPHREYKHCTMCNENYLTGTTKKLSNCSECNIPGKPQIILNEMYTSDQTITFNWSDTDNTTHYNLVIEKKNSNGLYEKYYRKDYASSGVIKKLEPGFYRAEIQSYNSNFFYDDGSDWIHTLSDYEYFIVNNSEGIFETTYIVMYENKGIVSIPYSIGNLVKTAKQNDEIAIIGYVFNCYGNLWLKTSEGYYIAFSGLKQKESNRIPIAEYNTAKMEVTCSSKSVFQDMISTSPVVETLNCGDLIEIDGYCYNQNGYLMYHLPNGYFVFSSYLKCITSDKNSPSNYVQAELKSFASVKELHEAPHSSSNITRKISKGDTVNIVGYEYNQYGNLWYLTDSGDYIYESYLSNYKKAENIPSDYKCQPFISTEAKLCQSEPYAAASLKQIFKSNTVINTVGYLNNLYGNKWYVCENGGYIYSGTSNLECNHLFEKTTIDSSCIHKGKEIITCKYCNYYQEKELALIPHNFSEWKIEVLATVHHKGTFKRMCLNCKQAETYESPCVLKNCFIMDGFISGLKPGCNLEFFKENYTNSETISIYTSTKTITTNTEIIFGYSDNSYDALKVVIRGDVDCDGLIDGRDSFIVDCLVNNLLSKDQVGEAVFTAADCNRNGEIDAEDIALLEGAGLKLNTIEQI